MVRVRHLFIAAIVSSCVLHPLYAVDTMLDDAQIKSLLHERLHGLETKVGIVVGVMDAGKIRVVSEGCTDLGGDKVDGNTIFEIGSVTKVFTSLLLADMVQRGEMKLDDPISKFLPASVKVPTRNNREITLLDLATHTSGLPRMPDNFAPKDKNNPFADYTVEQMYAFLAGYHLPRDIGTQYEYSNIGVGLLGHILCLKSGSTYESLVTERICKPLGMTRTCITLAPGTKMAAGHDATGAVVENFDLPTLAGAGALRSTVNDLLKFLKASMGEEKSDLERAMTFQQIPRHDAGSSVIQVALGWHITRRDGIDCYWHNGATGGYHAFIGFDKKNQSAAVVLVNAGIDIDDLGQRLLRKPEAPRTHVAITLDPEKLDPYVGKYQLGPGAKLIVLRDKDRLFVQLTGQPSFEAFPESEATFFYKVVDAQLTFVKNEAGETTHLILHQNGFDLKAAKEKK